MNQSEEVEVHLVNLVLGEHRHHKEQLGVELVRTVLVVEVHEVLQTLEGNISRVALDLVANSQRESARVTLVFSSADISILNLVCLPSLKMREGVDVIELAFFRLHRSLFKVDSSAVGHIERSHVSLVLLVREFADIIDLDHGILV